MKRLTAIFLTLLFGQIFSQNKPTDTVVFEFNYKSDAVIYRTHHEKKEISGFNILIGKKKIYFSTAVNANFKLKNKILKNIKNRIQLEQIIMNDNPEKHYIFIILFKEEYYNTDYLFRTIECH
ncbi:hypothetical protein [Flavobacterium sp. 14A]|uniref:hypothetical protein n=1 Tax=Flavobacterium sp. 14A TaxID=2735896 RepID=UPI00156DAB9B|nr:hypothetical protein [Flavobacterium sp. 14A]NRT12325.1 hypothetical protein [Flavobacterium sp. 14A]